MTPFLFIICSLACYRATVLIARDAGPWRIFARLRQQDRYSKLLKCPYCVSVWVAIFIQTAVYLSGVNDSFVVCVLLVLSYSAIAIALDRVFTADHSVL